ncbi:MAG: zinc ribbon domain-containing protein [Clostridiales bacterium]|nr:zinc ribbon domain-containing protein [Clostridiales bacterium]
MAKFCRYCGNPINDNARFCKSCGNSLAKPPVFCGYCGKPVSGIAKFCNSCGRSLAQPPVQPQKQTEIQKTVQPPVQTPIVQTAQPQKQPAAQQPVQSQPKVQTQPVQTTQPQVQAKVQQTVNNPVVKNAVQLSGVIDAPAGKGLFSYDMDSINRVGNMSQNIMTPVRSVMSFFPRVISGFKNVGKNPLSLISLILIPLIWIVLLILRRSGNDDNIVVKILSWLTYGGDTGNRSLAGVLGSSFGKGIVALAYSSLFTGGFGRLKSGVKTLFSKPAGQSAVSGKGLSVAWLLMGAGAGLILNRFIAGVPSWSGVMVVISAAFVSLQACGNSGGYLYSVARSFTSRAVTSGGGKTEDKNSIRMLLMGLIAGFVCMIPYSAGNSLISLITQGVGEGVLSAIPLVAGFVLLIVGMIMVIAGKKKAVKQAGQ